MHRHAEQFKSGGFPFCGCGAYRLGDKWIFERYHDDMGYIEGDEIPEIEIIRTDYARNKKMPRELTIAGRRIADDTPAYLIAEIGHNHAGDITKAIDMVNAAIEAGADAVKFQTRTPTEVYARGNMPGAYDFEADNPQWMARKYGEHREMLEFSPWQWHYLFQYCKRKGITAFSTPFDHKSADLLASFDVPAFKIASGDATNIPLIKHVASFGKPMIISTGGCEIEDVDRVVQAMGGTQAPFALLQCSCIYPAPDDVLNVRVVTGYRERYPNIVAGLSTHAFDWTPTLAAFTLGGRIFEHHFTTDRSLKGTDNHFSLTPPLLTALREACDRVLPALGSAEKRQDPRERLPTIERRKALYWRRQVLQGQVITADDLIALCPGDGVAPYYLEHIVGKMAAHNTGTGEKFQWHDLMVWASEDAEFQQAVANA